MATPGDSHEGAARQPEETRPACDGECWNPEKLPDYLIHATATNALEQIYEIYVAIFGSQADQYLKMDHAIWCTEFPSTESAIDSDKNPEVPLTEPEHDDAEETDTLDKSSWGQMRTLTTAARWARELCGIDD